jgi:hypothetical protein
MLQAPDSSRLQNIAIGFPTAQIAIVIGWWRMVEGGIFFNVIRHSLAQLIRSQVFFFLVNLTGT